MVQDPRQFVSGSEAELLAPQFVLLGLGITDERRGGLDVGERVIEEGEVVAARSEPTAVLGREQGNRQARSCGGRARVAGVSHQKKLSDKINKRAAVVLLSAPGWNLIHQILNG